MKPTSRTSSWAWRLLGRARPQAGSLSGLLLLYLAGAGINLLKPWPLKMIVDYVLPGKPLPTGVGWLAVLPGAGSPLGLLAWLTFSTLMVFLLGWVTSVIANYVQIDTSGRMTYGLAAEVFSHLQRLSLRFHNRWPTGDLVKRVAVDCRCIRALVIETYLPAVTAVATLIVVFALIWRMDPTLALLSLVVVPPLGILLRVYAKPMMDREYEQSELQGELMGHAEQVLTAIPIVQAFGREAAEGDRFAVTTERVGQSYLRSIATGLQFRIFTGATLATGTALLVAVGGRHVLEGRILLGDLLMFLSYLAYLYVPLETIAYLSMSYANAAAGARRVFELMESNERIREVPDAIPRPVNTRGQGIAVHLENLSFSYERDRKVLHQVSLTAAPGETIALVGPTGAGKTTIVSLILRLFDPDHGRVTFDGVDIRKYQVASLRESVAIVLQEAFLLPLTIAENIAYARPTASRKEVIAAARAARAEEFIDKLPQG
ncbi:MAG: ABC transporter ATP-binding protein, partial [Acidobacteriota bacterium]